MDQAKFMGEAALSKTVLESFTYHGGNLGAARRLFPEAPAPWIDLSTGINPHPYPLCQLSPESWTRLPDAESLARLEAIAARRYGAADAAGVIAAPGTQALIQMLALLRSPARVGVLGAAYSGHAQAWRPSGLFGLTITATSNAANSGSVATLSKRAPAARHACSWPL